MDFFNKLSKKASETYQITKEKTTQISGELKLKNRISENKSKIESIYTEIGKMVVEANLKNEEVSKEEVLPRCEEIARIKEEIEKAETEILALKKIKKCICCGLELPEEAEFCSKCGKEQPKIEKVEVEVKEEASQNAEETEVTEVNNVENSEEPKE